MRLFSVLGAYQPASSNFMFHIGFFISNWLIEPGPYYLEGYKTATYCPPHDPVWSMKTMKWTHFGLALTTLLV